MKDVKGREEVFKYIKSCCTEERNNLFSVAMVNGIIGNELTSQKRRNLGHLLGKTRPVRLAKNQYRSQGVGQPSHQEVCKGKSVSKYHK